MDLCLDKCYPSFKPPLDITLFIPLFFGDRVIFCLVLRPLALPLASCVTFNISFNL